VKKKRATKEELRARREELMQRLKENPGVMQRLALEQLLKTMDAELKLLADEVERSIEVDVWKQTWKEP
jgi:hypothetical protein